MNLKKRLQGGELAMGTWLTVGHPQIAEAICSTGMFQWLAVDLEHSTPTIDQAASIFLVCEKWNVTPLIRTLGHDPYFIRRFFDAGARGVIIPVVESQEEVEKIKSHLFYPPKGKRGVCLSRINEWGDNFMSHYQEFSPVLIAQIETQKGVENADEIISDPDIDAVFIGPYDLSGSLGSPGNFESDEFHEHLNRVLKVAKKHKKAIGAHVVEPNVEELKQKIDAGYNFLAFGTDLICMRSSLTAAKAVVTST